MPSIITLLFLAVVGPDDRQCLDFMNHVVVISIKMFAGLLIGTEQYDALDWLLFSSFVVVGNLVGGLGLVTVARFMQIGRPQIRERAKRQRLRSRLFVSGRRAEER